MFLENIENIIQNNNKIENNKFIFLLSSMVNLPELKIIFDYLLEQIQNNKAIIRFNFDENLRIALKTING